MFQWKLNTAINKRIFL